MLKGLNCLTVSALKLSSQSNLYFVFSFPIEYWSFALKMYMLMLLAISVSFVF